MQVRSQSLATELAPSDSQLEFHRLVAKLPAAAYTCDANGLITYFNRRAMELWGRAPRLKDPVDRFCGSFRLLSLDGAPLAHEDCWMARALREGRPYDGLEMIIERPDGSRITALAHANPLHDERGDVIGAVNVLVDISERRRAEMARLHLAAIVDSSDDAIVSKNLDGVIQSWNAAAQRLFGYTAEEAVGRHISFLMPPERRDEEDRILARLRAGERIYHFDTVRLRKDGRLIDVSVTISPIRDDAGRIVGASKIVRDIADRKKAEEQIYNLLTRLKDADRRKDEFVATLAHELRGPLAPLWSMLEVIRRGEGDGDTLQRAHETMERQLGQMVRLVDDLLDVGRIASNKLQLKKERVDLAAVIGQAVEVCRPLAERAKHKVTVNLPAQPIYLDADPARLAQVFSNLLNNACKYTDEGGSIRLTVERDNGDVLVTVTDTGIGIPADRLAGVFELFSQVTSASERSRGGLGIGLSVVKRLVELHGGSVSVASAGPGQGSELSVRLPIFEDEPRTRRKAPPKQRRAATARRILVVDDNTDSAAALAMLLKIGGHKTSTAYDGLAAVDAVERVRPEVVLLDLSLPKMDGYEVARQIRTQPWGKDILLIALTGWGQEEDRRRSMEAGFDEHMIKPVDFDALAKLLASR